MDKRSNASCRRTVNRLLGVSLLALAFGAGVGAQAEEDRRVRIINETTHTMMRFYASNIGRSDWEEDILGQSTLAPGNSVVINIDDGSGYCLYDFKGVFDDGEEVIKNRIDVCKLDSFRFTEN
jgi:hypothetical protein